MFIHTKQEQVLSEVLDRVGWAQNIIVNQRTGHVVDGHLRVAHAISRGEPTVPVVFIDVDESDEALILATLDPISAMAGRDDELLASLIQDVHIEPGAVADLLASLNGEQPRTDLHEDDADLTPPAEPITRPGDLWLLGDHRLLCGDSTKAEDVARLMDGRKAAMVFTDPPYGIDLDTDWEDRVGTTGYGRKYRPVIGDDLAFDFAAVCTPKCSEQFWWGADYYRNTIPSGGGWFVWDKRAESQDSMIGSAFELCWSMKEHKRELARIPWVGYVAHDPGEGRTHPTQKPVALVEWFLGRFSAPNAVVWDGFGGSGSTLIAAEQTGRVAYLMEIDPGYCDVIVNRWQVVAGRKAVRDGTQVAVHA